MGYEKPKKIGSKMPVAFNMAAHHAQFIHNTLQTSTNCFLKGDIGNWYWHLKAIRILINHELSKGEEGERAELDKFEKECNAGTNSWNKYKTARQQGLEGEMSKHTTTKNAFSNKVEDYAKRIMDLLNDQGYFPKKEDDSDI